MIIVTKIILTILWLAIFYNWVNPFEGITYSVLHWTGIFMIVAHIGEAIVFYPRAKQAGGNMALHIIQLFFFGYVHNMTLGQPETEQA